MFLSFHIVQRKAGDSARFSGGGAIDHVAFRGVDLEGTRVRLRAGSVAFEEAVGSP
jgi:hypothetical protein